MTTCIFHDKDSAEQERQLFEIVEQAYGRREKILVYASDMQRAAELDRILWILKQEAFIPHRILEQKGPAPEVPVGIVISEINPIGAKILVADGHCSLDFACKFESIHEFVNRSSPQMHQACRDRFRDYRSRRINVDYLK